MNEVSKRLSEELRFPYPIVKSVFLAVNKKNIDISDKRFKTIENRVRKILENEDVSIFNKIGSEEPGIDESIIQIFFDISKNILMENIKRNSSKFNNIVDRYRTMLATITLSNIRGFKRDCIKLLNQLPSVRYLYPKKSNVIKDLVDSAIKEAKASEKSKAYDLVFGKSLVGIYKKMADPSFVKSVLHNILLARTEFKKDDFKGINIKQFIKILSYLDDMSFRSTMDYIKKLGENVKSSILGSNINITDVNQPWFTNKIPATVRADYSSIKQKRGRSGFRNKTSFGISPNKITRVISEHTFRTMLENRNSTSQFNLKYNPHEKYRGFEMGTVIRLFKAKKVDKEGVASKDHHKHQVSNYLIVEERNGNTLQVVGGFKNGPILWANGGIKLEDTNKWRSLLSDSIPNGVLGIKEEGSRDVLKFSVPPEQFENIIRELKTLESTIPKEMDYKVDDIKTISSKEIKEEIQNRINLEKRRHKDSLIKDFNEDERLKEEILKAVVEKSGNTITDYDKFL